MKALFRKTKNNALIEWNSQKEVGDHGETYCREMTAAEVKLVEETGLSDYTKMWADDENQVLVEIDDPDVPPPTMAEQLSALWSGLDDDTRTVIYQHAPAVLIAWERHDYSVMSKLILANTAPELAALKSQVAALLPAQD